MSGWFDSYAKRSAQRAPASASHNGRTGLTRRQVIVRGSVVAAAAWTAPTLLASSAAAVGQSTCKSGETYCTNGSVSTGLCCPANYTCYPSANAGQPYCAPPDVLGGTCSNSGEGVCSDGSKCNSGAANGGKSCNYCTYAHTCGGEGSQCNQNSDCFGSGTGFSTCSPNNAKTSGSKFCRRICTNNAGCNTGAGQQCYQGLCSLTCQTDKDCPDGSAGCNANGYCNYMDQGGI